MNFELGLKAFQRQLDAAGAAQLRIKRECQKSSGWHMLGRAKHQASRGR